MNTPVNFKLAKLLKEKGYNEPCVMKYSLGLEKDNYTQLQYHLDYSCTYIKIPIQDNFFALKLSNEDHSHAPSAPTISDVLSWLYDKHKIWVSVDFAIKSSVGNGFGSKISQRNNNVLVIPKSIFDDRNFSSMDLHFEASYKSPTEAYESSIEYILNNMISI
jgi:hypothetical protein